MKTNMHKPAAGRLPGDRDVWLFIFAELMMFGAFFLAYIVNRSTAVELYNAAQQTLDRNLGVLNTVFLIASSWAVVQALAAARRDQSGTSARYLMLAIALAAAFVVVKYFEYSAKFRAGIDLTTNDFYMFYFCLTMIHLAHVVAGSVILLVLCLNTRQGKYRAGRMQGMEAGASYWHMVDLLWIFLFPLLYLLR